ncbi:hypothetical protein Tco_0138583, partial [Tanacetum coccineum]
MTAIKEKKKRALADLRYRALKGKPMKQSEVTQMMRNLVKNQWCAAHNGTITMTAVKDLDNIISMEDDTTHGGFHVESPVRPDDAPTPTTDAAGRAEDPAPLTSLSAKLDRCMGRIDSLETELGKSKKIIGAAEGDLDIQDDIDLDGLSRMASTALGHDQPAVPSEDVEEQEEEEVPLRRKRSAYRRARTEFSTPAFEQFQANLSAGVLPHTAVPEPAGPSVAADKGKVPMPDLDISAEFLAEDTQARKRFKEEQVSKRLVQRLRAEDLAQEDLPNVSEERAKELDDLMIRMTETDGLTLMMQVGSNPALARELLGADVNEENFIERMNDVKEKKKRALVDLRYRALKGKLMKKSEVTQMMRNLVKNQWCAVHNGTITMKDVKAMNPQQLIEEYEYICRRLEKDRLTDEKVERVSSQPASVPAATTLPADDPDSAGGGSSNPAGSATPMAGSAAFNTAGGVFGATVTDSTVTTTADMDSVGSRRGPSPSNVSTDQLPIAVLCESTSGDINEFFLESDEEEQINILRFRYILLTMANSQERVWLTIANGFGYQKLDGIHFPCSCWDEKWLVQEGTALELASPEQTATGKDMLNPLYGCDGLPKTVRVFQFTLDSRSEKLDWLIKSTYVFDVATSFDSVVHRVHAVSFDVAILDVAATIY